MHRPLVPHLFKIWLWQLTYMWLDYCNSVLAGVSGQLLRRLQVIQNAAARLVTGVWKYEHMTPVLHSLHWLPIRQQVTFKTAVIVFKCLHGQALPYLIELCRPTSLDVGHRPLRSACTHRLVVPSTVTAAFLSTAPQFGTVCRTTFGQRTCR